MAEDLVNEALLWAVSQEVKWSSQAFLFYSIKKHVLYQMDKVSKRKENREFRLDSYLENNPESWEISTENMIHNKNGISPNELLFEERKMFFEEAKNRAISILNGDKYALLVFRSMLDGNFEPRYIASDLNMTPAFVNSTKRRITRKLQAEMAPLMDFFKAGLSQNPEEA